MGQAIKPKFSEKKIVDDCVKGFNEIKGNKWCQTAKVEAT